MDPKVIIPSTSGPLNHELACEPDINPARYYEAVDDTAVPGGQEQSAYTMLGFAYDGGCGHQPSSQPEEALSADCPFAEGGGDSAHVGSIGRVRRFLLGLIPFEEIVDYRAEFSGMFGDLGLYIPIVISLSNSGQISLGATLIFSGLANILTGVHFKVPMCVQPMKSIAAAALSQKMTNAEIMACGLATSAIVTFLGLTNLIGVVSAVIPNSVVRGLQLGLGLSFFQNAAGMLPKNMSWGDTYWMHWDGSLVACVSLILALLCVRSRTVPTAALLFLVGVIVAAVRLHQSGGMFEVSITQLWVVHITPKDLLYGFIYGAVPQVPTTLLNSCIAVCKLSEDLYPNRRTNVTARSVSSSVGLMNLVFNCFGGFPMCHGAGGLAGQHRFGARTNLSIIVLGLCKVVLGLFFANGILRLILYFPQGILAAMLAISAFELAIASRSAFSGDSETARLCILTGCFTVFFNTAIGFCAGLIAAYLVTLSTPCLGQVDEANEATTWVRRIVQSARERVSRVFWGESVETRATA